MQHFFFKVNNVSFTAVSMYISVGFVNGKGMCQYRKYIFPGLLFMEKIDISLSNIKMFVLTGNELTYVNINVEVKVTNCY